MSTELVFEYVLQFPDGEFYTGEFPETKGPRHHALTFTEYGAYAKINRDPICDDCAVVRLA